MENTEKLPQEQTNVQVESSSFKRGSRLKRLLTGKRKLLILLVTIIALLGSLIYLGHRELLPGQKIIFTINGKNYTDKEVDKLIDWPVKRSKSKDEASKLAYDYLKQQQAARNIGIELTQQDIGNALNKMQKTGIGSINENDPWIQLVAYSNALNDKILIQSGGSPKGYSLIFYFGNKLERRPFEKEQVPGFGNKELIEADKRYAKERSEFYKLQLDNHKMTPDEAYNEVKKDPKLGLDYVVNTNKSSHFGTKSDTRWEEEVYYKDVINEIKSQQPQGAIQIRTGKTATTETPASDKEFQETFYYFVVLDQAARSINKNRLDNAVKELKADYYGYK